MTTIALSDRSLSQPLFLDRKLPDRNSTGALTTGALTTDPVARDDHRRCYPLFRARALAISRRLVVAADLLDKRRIEVPNPGVPRIGRQDVRSALDMHERVRAS